jgi:hypothetical protein
MCVITYVPGQVNSCVTPGPYFMPLPSPKVQACQRPGVLLLAVTVTQALFTLVVNPLLHWPEALMQESTDAKRMRMAVLIKSFF